jgi:inositol phosphorylceramide synthase regulatory subunit
MFFADHVLSTLWTVFFAVTWWIYTPHDGRRQASSAAQEEIMQGGMNNRPPMTDTERERAAMMIWNQEKGFAATVITLGWLSKVRPYYWRTR